ncbi:MAG: alpha-xylosidase [Armatimonadota bacterium]|nr:MAG: alpha-xylosidase [Armatimonadota bacterium]
MKFTRGVWLMREGVTPHYAVHVHDFEQDDNSLTLYAPDKWVTSRVATLDTPLLTIKLSSPIENVIRIQVWHHRGTPVRPPYFELQEHPTPSVRIEGGEGFLSLTTGRLTVRVRTQGEWQLDFYDGEKRVTTCGAKSIGYMDTPEGRFMVAQLGIGVGECIYGLGERFTPFVKNGQVVEMWNEDGGTATEIAYKNIPFYITNRGYGVFVAHPEKVSFEVASEHVERVQFSVPGEYLEYYLVYGPTPREVISRYTALTGRPALPPAWSFGLWLSTSFTTDYDEQTVTSFIQGMAERGIPLSVFHFDCFWMREFHWCDFVWDRRVFPDPEGMLRRLKERGLHVCVWMNPYIAQRSRLFEEGMKGGYLLKRPDGSVWQTDLWQAGMGIVDFTNSEARQWFQSQLRRLLEMGVDCFKTDFGERIPTDVVYHDGSDPVRMHNFYSYLYNKTVHELLTQVRGEGEAVLFARSATAGGQRFPVHWGGDCTATYESMAETLRGGLSLSLCGFGFWSHDIGGFVDTAPADLYKRWCAFGLLSSHSRLHGSSSYRVPWLFDEEAVEVLRFFAKLKCRLMPYLYRCAVEAHEEGIPVMRAMFVEFPEDPGCDTLDRQYMLGPSLLVAPVFSPEGVVDYYLPAGRWTNLLSGRVVEGGRWIKEKHGFLSLPLMVRPGSVIPMGAVDTRPDYHYPDGVTFHVFDMGDGVEVKTHVPDVKGRIALVLHTRREGGLLTFRAEGDTRRWSILLRNVANVHKVEGGQEALTAEGTAIQPVDGAETIAVVL